MYSTLPNFTCSTSNTSKNAHTSQEWIKDSGCTTHMSYDHSVFSKYARTDRMTIEIGVSSIADGAGKGDTTLTLIVNCKNSK